MSDPVLDPDQERRVAIAANSEVWHLLEQAERTSAEDEAMVRAAYAAAHHWSKASGREPANEARAEWLLSRVHAVLGRSAAAHHHAERCWEVVAAAGLEDFDLAYAHEALARAAACQGDLARAAQERAAALAVPIADADDRDIFAADLAGEPWFGVLL